MENETLKVNPNTEEEALKISADTEKEPANAAAGPNHEKKPAKTGDRKIPTKYIAIAAVLTALSILIPLYMPTFYIDPAMTMSVTLFSHLPIMIAMFINPIVTVFTCIGALCAFIIKGTPVTVWARAGSHLIFALTGSLIMHYGKQGYRGLSFYALFVLVLLLHTFGEMLAAVFAISLGATGSITAKYIFVTIGLLNVGHTLLDYSVAVLVYTALGKAKLVDNKFDLRISFKKNIANGK